MENKLTIYYDPDCGLCYRSCLRIRKYLFLKNTEIAKTTENHNADQIFKNDYSWSVYEHATGKYLKKSTAFWRLVYYSPFFIFYYISYLPFVIWIGDKIYDKVARSREITCNV